MNLAETRFPLPPAPFDPSPPAAAAIARGIGGWVITRHALALDAFRIDALTTVDAASEVERVSVRAARPVHHLVQVLRGNSVFQSGDDHAASRAAMIRTMRTGMERWTPARVDALCTSLIEGLPEGEADMLAGYGAPLATALAADMLGLPRDIAAALRDTGAELLTAPRPFLSLREHAALNTLAADAVRRLGEAVPAVSHAERNLHLDLFFLTAASVTVASVLASACWTLAQLPALQRRLRSDCRLTAGFVEEMLRLAPPIARSSARRATCSVEIGGHAISRGELVTIDIARCQRDPAAFPNPDVVDLERKAALMSFGNGAHACIGARLARIEFAAALQALLRDCDLAPATALPVLSTDADMPFVKAMPVLVTRRTG
ncbi:cytochrome P450 [Sphingomonas sp. ID0503]|uniref:cytochrome P450 n=1 Tax=Sphingomonas sp. ID0503 TaxID=3399691 RepID=UPI003AFB077C